MPSSKLARALFLACVPALLAPRNVILTLWFAVFRFPDGQDDKGERLAVHLSGRLRGYTSRVLFLAAKSPTGSTSHLQLCLPLLLLVQPSP